MRINQVAAQLYTIREHIKTPADIAAAMKRVRQIGYGAVQVSGMGPIAEAELAKILDGEGLVCCATHEPTDRILDEPQRVVERLRRLKCRYTACPSPGTIKFNCLKDVQDFAARLDSAGRVLHEAGLVLTYHNHHIEFRRIEGRLALDVIYWATDPRYLQGEIDTYWVQIGGGSPVEWCRRLKGRLPLLHLKEVLTTEDWKTTYGEIGRGALDWKEIIAAAEQSGCEWFIVEQDVCPGDPFDSLKISFDYIKEQLCT